MLNVALFASAFYPGLGGVEEAVRQLARQYRLKGIGVIVLTNRWPRSLPFFETYEETPVYRLPFRVPIGGLKARISYQVTHRSIRGTMLRILRKHNVSVLHVQCVSTNALYAMEAKLALELPLVVTTQGERTMDADQIYQRSSFMNDVLRKALRSADAITACSNATLDDMERYWGKPFRDRASVVYNGVEVSDFEHAAPYRHRRPFILGLGRLVAQKGFDLLIRAFSSADLPEHDLLLAGEGPERGALESLVAELNLTGRVQFVGRADRQLAVALFKGCEFFVLPSRSEPFGIVSLEAMAVAKAVIGFDVGGVPEVVSNRETGIILPREDVDSLSKAMTRLGRDLDLRNLYGLAGVKHVAKFNWVRIADEYINVYNFVRSRQVSVNATV